MSDLFEGPTQTKKVRDGVFAYQYKNGTININGRKYILFSMTSAINNYRKDFPKYKKQ